MLLLSGFLNKSVFVLDYKRLGILFLRELELLVFIFVAAILVTGVLLELNGGVFNILTLLLGLGWLVRNEFLIWFGFAFCLEG